MGTELRTNGPARRIVRASLQDDGGRKDDVERRNDVDQREGAGLRVAVLRTLLAWLVVVGPFGCRTAAVEPADLVLRGGKVVTVDPMQPEARALAVRGETIVAVGTDAEIDTYIGDGTEVIDLDGRLAVPGLIEGHGHYMSLGESLTQLDLRFAADWNEIVGMVAAAVSEASPGEWIVGRGWHQDKWQRPPEPSVEGLPVHAGLSAVSADNPVMLEHTSGHGVFANARALELVGIDTRTPDPPGGEIVRDEQGAPIGMLRETASGPLEAAFGRRLGDAPPVQREREHRRWVQLAAENALANGITSFQDMGSSFETVDLLRTMADEGNLPVRLYIAIQEPAEEMASRLAEYRMVGRGGGYLTVRAIGEKVLDGALGTHGGWLLEPYTDLPRSVGFNVTPVEEIRASAELAVEHDYQMAIQGIGDRAVRELLDIYEDAFASDPATTDLRWRIEHAQVIHPDDVPRFAASGVIAGIQGVFACSDGIWVRRRLGDERTRERGYIYRTLIDAGAAIMNGTDPPVELIDPIASFHCSVARELPDGSLFLPEQAMTREQALGSYTLDNAYAAFEDHIKGSLTPGKLADITVLSKDIMTIPADEIPTARVLYTIVGGAVRYRAEGGPR